MRKTVVLLLAIVLVLSLFACKGEERLCEELTLSFDEINFASSVTREVKQSSASVFLYKKVSPENATVSWSVDDESVISLGEETARGIYLVAKGAGTATVTAKSLDKEPVIATATLTVLPATGNVLTISPSSISGCFVGFERIFSCTLDGNVTLPNTLVSFSSSNPTIAGVSAEGKLTVFKAGTVTVTASYGSLSTTCVVTTDTDAPRFWLSSATDSYALSVGQSFSLPDCISYDPTIVTSAPRFFFSCSDVSVLSISRDGVAEALTAGTVTVTITNDFNADVLVATVTVF